MKITCDNCGAKYSIADEKVRGKVFKIRCKKCSNIIVVRGTADDEYARSAGSDEPDRSAAAEDPGRDYAPSGAAGGGYAASAEDGYAASAEDGYAASAGDGYAASAGDGYAASAGEGGETPIWHAVVGSDQVGPMTASEIRERFAAGEISVDSYIWREGFSDWLRLTAVDEFSDVGQATAVAVSAGAGNVGDGGAGAWNPGADPAEQEPGWGGGQTASPAESQGAASDGMFAQGAAAASGGDLFGGGGQPQDPQDAGSGGVFAPSSPASSGGDLFGAAGGAGVFSEDAREQMPSDPSIPVQQMTGQRGENSVLFSLANLQALATGGPGAKPSSSASASESSKAGMASGGGSGLIDIKAMAATVSPRASSSPSASDDALPSIGGFGGPIAAAPVLMPTAGDDRPAWLIPTLIGGGVVVLALAVTLVVLIAGKKDTPHQPQVAVNMAGQTAGGTAAGKTAGVTETSGTAAKPGAATAGKTAGTTPPAKGASAATPPKASGKSASSSTGRSKRRSRRGKKRHQSGTHRASTPTRMASVAPKTARKKRGTKKKHDELDDLLDGAMGGGKKRRPARRAAPAPKKPAAAPASNLPDKLGRSQIVSGMGRIKGRIKACRDRFRVPGMAMVRVAIGANGRVSSARVSGIFAGTPTGSCVARAVKSARFPKTKRPSTIKYPFVLR